MSRNIFIDNIDLDVALEKFSSALKITPKYETVLVENSLSRVTKSAVYAQLSSPFFNAAAMDGIAVKCEKTFGASEVNPIILKENNDFIYINTGNVINEPYSAVIMIEDVTELKKGEVSIIKGAHPWQHVRPVGEDIVSKEMIIPSKHQIRAIDLGALISGGVTNIEVYKKMSVGMLPTGSEIISNIGKMKTGKIIDSNSVMFQGLVTENGGVSKKYEPVEDKVEVLKSAILKGVEENDLLIINAGSSAGSKDYTVDLIKELGQVIVHGIAIKPGKPTILGIIDGTPVIGIPGYPVSAYFSFDFFIKPLIIAFGGLQKTEREHLEVVMAKRVVSSFKHKEKVRVNIGYINNKFVAVPIGRGAGTTMSLVRADGIVTIPRNCEGLESGEVVSAELLKPETSIKKAVVAVGSHDIIMDILSDKLPLSSSHVGSMGGIMAMKRGECNLAPIHLLDEATGTYNKSFVDRYFPDSSVVLIKGVKRAQGFIVPKGNPKNITGFNDLKREDVFYVNRQRGAGTRLLLDYHLKLDGIDSTDVKGYGRVVPTHMAVAAAVKTGTADTGLGIRAAAEYMDLGFIEVTYEDYDFIVEESMLQSKKIQDFIKLLRSTWFKNELKKIGGYLDVD